ncbi:SET and MYND domain-containing protein 4-like [Acanthaster planci]|uniref:SET and MYND domain-containing protein 4-like n=1 Tax=Acanthaster planci TaxID=133434 RepID=A0A8B7XZP0_ACAPL|nr:SET and MYND domain-containing protein 4-like [Acanthaster planci]
METFEWENFLKVAYRDWCNVQSLNKFRRAPSNAERVSLCIGLAIWSDKNVCRLIKRCVEQSYMETSGKSDEVSRSWREKGNELFKERHYNEALLCYTQSVLTASCNIDNADTSNRVELAMAFGNRSATLYHLNQYELALQECDQAISHGYPRASLHKLLQRKGLCLMEMGQQHLATIVLREALLALDEAVNLSLERKESLKSEIEKLLNNCTHPSVSENTSVSIKPTKPEDLRQSSDKLASASRSLGLRFNLDRGRYLVADLPVNAGELLIKEIPYAVILLPEYRKTHCHYSGNRAG